MNLLLSQIVDLCRCWMLLLRVVLSKKLLIVWVFESEESICAGLCEVFVGIFSYDGSHRQIVAHSHQRRSWGRSCEDQALTYAHKSRSDQRG